MRARGSVTAMAGMAPGLEWLRTGLAGAGLGRAAAETGRPRLAGCQLRSGGAPAGRRALRRPAHRDAGGAPGSVDGVAVARRTDGSAPVGMRGGAARRSPAAACRAVRGGGARRRYRPDRGSAKSAEHASENRVDVLEVIAEVEVLFDLGIAQIPRHVLVGLEQA